MMYPSLTFRINGVDVDAEGELIGRQQALDAFAFIRDRAPGFGD